MIHVELGHPRDTPLNAEDRARFLADKELESRKPQRHRMHATWSAFEIEWCWESLAQMNAAVRWLKAENDALRAQVGEKA